MFRWTNGRCVVEAGVTIDADDMPENKQEEQTQENNQHITLLSFYLMA